MIMRNRKTWSRRKLDHQYFPAFCHGTVRPWPERFLMFIKLNIQHFGQNRFAWGGSHRQWTPMLDPLWFWTALNLDAMSTSHPIEIPVGHPDEVDEIFDAISYAKGNFV